MEEIARTSTDKRCAVVTGGSKGIGLEICRQLANSGIRVVLTARDEGKGKAAVKSLQDSGLPDVVFHQLDISNSASMLSLADFIRSNFGKLDILVNNAADGGVVINSEEFRAFKGGAAFGEVKDENADLLKGIMDQNYGMAVQCLKTNYYGTKAVTEALLPLLQLSTSARVVNVSSTYGQLEHIRNESIKEELGNIDSLTEERIDEIIEQFLKDFKENKLQDNGWPLTVSAYKVSKVTLNAYSRILAKRLQKVCINCVHPGYCITDITCNTGILTAEEGAQAPVMVALLPDGGPSGLYFDRMNPSDF